MFVFEQKGIWCDNGTGNWATTHKMAENDDEHIKGCRICQLIQFGSHSRRRNNKHSPRKKLQLKYMNLRLLIILNFFFMQYLNFSDFQPGSQVIKPGPRCN